MNNKRYILLSETDTRSCLKPIPTARRARLVIAEGDTYWSDIMNVYSYIYRRIKSKTIMLSACYGISGSQQRPKKVSEFQPLRLP